MAFSSDLAQLVSNQLTRFVTLNRHQLAGQVANLDFWLAQVRNALDVIDGYGVRYVRLEGAQEQYAAAHDTKQFTLYPDERIAGPITAPLAPRRIPDRELQKARRGLIEAASRLLTRCWREEMITEEHLTTACVSLGLGVEAVRRG